MNESPLIGSLNRGPRLGLWGLHLVMSQEFLLVLATDKGVATGFSVLVIFVTIWFHLKNYKRPDLQRYTIRILLMVPIYSITAWISLYSHSSHKYLHLLREMYEALVLFMFFCLIVGFAGGEAEVVRKFRDRPPIRHGLLLRFCLSPMDVPLSKPRSAKTT